MAGWELLRKLIAIWEVALGIKVLDITLLKNHVFVKKEKIVIVIFTIALGLLLAFNRNNSFVSWTMFLFCILTSFCVLWIISKKSSLMILIVTWAYYSTITIIEIFLAYLGILFLKQDFYSLIYINETYSMKEVFYFGACTIVTVLIMIIKNIKKKVPLDIQDYRNVLIVFDIVLYSILWKYHSLLDDMARGVEEIQGINMFSFLCALIIFSFVGLIVFKYKIIERENEALLLKEEVSKEKYKELSLLIAHNEQLRHDMKNHFLVIKGYLQEKDTTSIERYIDSINDNYLKVELNDWTDNEIVDIIISQKYKSAKIKGISFKIDADSLNEVGLSESELCSLFGNLLDNAIEAAEKSEEKWIKVCVKKVQNMLYIEIKNSFYIEPVIKNGEFITTKDNKEVHGYGLKCVKRIVEKYDGRLSYQISRNIFEIKISFFDM